VKDEITSMKFYPSAFALAPRLQKLN